MSIILGQINPFVGDLKGNAEKISAVLRKHQPGSLFVFPELSICGYPPQDLLEFPWFVDKCLHQTASLAKSFPLHSFLVGLPFKSGDRLYNAAAFCSGGIIKDMFFKTLLPTYDVFYEHRYFTPNYKDRANILNWCGIKYLITICEDIWFDQDRYDWDPVENANKYDVHGIINLSASPYYAGKRLDRWAIAKSVVKRTNIEILAWCNQYGLNDQVLFDGTSFFCLRVGNDIDGMGYFQASSFKEATLEINTSPGILEKAISSTGTFEFLYKDEREELLEIKDALVLGIRDYFEKSKREKKAIIGLSGGIDSALAACLVAEALGPDNVYGYTMPTEFSTAGSINNSFLLAKNLGIHCDEITIGDIHDLFREKLGYKKDFKEGDLVDQNIQPRIRMIMLMARSAISGGLVVGTSNKSELALGYGTLYGDLSCGLNPLGDLKKTEVYAISRTIYKDKIPQESLYQPPSAELAHNQKDTDSLPPYDILDPKIVKFLEHKEEIEEDLMHKIALNQFKREQSPIIIKISRKAFGQGWRFPILQNFF